MNEFFIEGTIVYDGLWAYLKCPEDIGVYYRTMVHRVFGEKLQNARGGPHITLVAGAYEDASSHPLWRTNEGKKLRFSYTHINNADGYWWLVIKDDFELRQFRINLGLNPELKYKFHLSFGTKT